MRNIRYNRQKIRNKASDRRCFLLLKKTFFAFSFLLYLLINSINSSAQSDTVHYEDIVIDTIPQDSLRKHSPRRAALYSTILPGLGQIYNKKYWKIPIVYVGMGTGITLSVYFHKNFKSFKDAFLLRDAGKEDKYPALSNDALINEMDRWGKYRDISIAVSALFYILNIVDANVDAYFMYFDVSENLSLNLCPPNTYICSTPPIVGFKLTYKF